MAQKRMFDKRVVSSDRFIDLPHSSKALYFMAGMEADDKGFFQPRRIQRMCGFTDDDFKILISKGFFITFESGVMVVTDWNKNNWLDSRRIVETEYIDELNMLKLVNDKYEYLEEKNIAKQMLSENSIEENSIEENNILYSNQNDYEKEFEELWKQYPKKIGKQDALKHYTNARKSGTTFEEVKEGLKKYLEYCGNTKWYSPKDGSTWFHKKSWNDVFEQTTSLKQETEEEWSERMEREIKEMGI